MIANMILNVYMGILYMDLYRVGIVRSDKRPSFKLLKKALENAHSENDKKKEENCKKYYTTWVCIFWLMVVTALLSVASNIEL